jgi:cupin fold WbuC family metalloprotein
VISAIKFIDDDLLNEVTAEARGSPRGRKNRNFHQADDSPAHRLLNAIEPGSYVAPHRHLDPHKDETMIVLRGRLGLVVFDAAGAVAQTAVLSVEGGTPGVDIPHGAWHTVLALESGTVFFEAKAGPYQTLTPEERAPWAPQEGAAEAGGYYARLMQLFPA